MIKILILLCITHINTVMSYGHPNLNRTVLEYILKNQFGGPYDLYNVTSIDISGQNIYFMDKDTFKGLTNIKALYLTNNYIQVHELDDEVFGNLENLEELYISSAFDRYSYWYDYQLVFKSLSRLTKLKILSMNSVPVILDKPYYENFTKLESLELEFSISRNSKYGITSNAFKGLKNLKILSLAHNSLEKSDIQFECFHELESLEVLDLSLNYLGSPTLNNEGQVIGLPDPNIFFKKMSNLKKLYLMYNHIHQLDDGYFEKLSKLEYLSLVYNPIDIFAYQHKPVNKETFRGLKNLKTLHLYQTYLGYVNDSCFEYLENLEELNVFRSSIPFFKKTFKGLTNLKSLVGGMDRGTNMELSCWCESVFEYLINLNSLKLTGWNFVFKNDSNIFNGLENLRTLVLSNNKIGQLHSRLFAKLKNLEKLDLSQNKIKSINFDTFFGLSNLKTLDLSQNTIDEIQNKSFEMLGILEILDLSRNMLSTVTRTQFQGLNKIKHLLLDKNKINSIDYNLVQGLSSLIYLELSGNGLTISIQGLNILIV